MTNEEDNNYFENNDGLNKPVYSLSEELSDETEDNLGHIFYSVASSIAILGGVVYGLCKSLIITGEERIKNLESEVMK